jgi:hypothetical protein
MQIMSPAKSALLTRDPQYAERLIAGVQSANDVWCDLCVENSGDGEMHEVMPSVLMLVHSKHDPAHVVESLQVLLAPFIEKAAKYYEDREEQADMDSPVMRGDWRFPLSMGC